MTSLSPIFQNCHPGLYNKWKLLYVKEINTINTSFILCILSKLCYSGNMFQVILVIFRPMKGDLVEVMSFSNAVFLLWVYHECFCI